jgi:hypothetical protein
MSGTVRKLIGLFCICFVFLVLYAVNRAEPILAKSLTPHGAEEVMAMLLTLAGMICFYYAWRYRHSSEYSTPYFLGFLGIMSFVTSLAELGVVNISVVHH